MVNPKRYETMMYRRLGTSGLKLPLLSLGLWYNFGGVDDYAQSKKLILAAFDAGITHFDLANNYGPPPGSSEITFGRVLREELSDYRDELIISTKAGYGMWPGPYGDFGSRKYLMSSIDQSLKRLGIPYVDIFYHHRPDPGTDLYETMLALADIVRQGKALYIGLSNYNANQLRDAGMILRDLDVPYIITQPSYSMFNRWIEDDGLLEAQYDLGGGTICFSPLAQGLLTNKYLKSVPEDSRAKKEHMLFLNERDITPAVQEKLQKLNQIAQARGQSLSQLALAWALRDERMTSVLIGVSKVSQLEENLKTLDHLSFTNEELDRIEAILM